MRLTRRNDNWRGVRRRENRNYRSFRSSFEVPTFILKWQSVLAMRKDLITARSRVECKTARRVIER